MDPRAPKHLRRRASTVVAVIAVCSLGWPTSLEAAPTSAPTLAREDKVSTALVPGATRTIAKTLPWRANMVGVSYLGGDEAATGEIRAVGGAWHELHFHSEDRPDGDEAARASRRITSDPVWLGATDRIEIRLAVTRGAGAIRDIRLHAINTAGDARTIDIFSRAARTIASWLRATPRDARAGTVQPKIISRSGWGADESWRDSTPSVASELKMVFVHHTDSGNTYSRSQAPAVIRGIYRYHTKTRGYSDIAYNFLIDRYGQIYEGRYGGITKAVIGAHTLGFNRYTSGIALVGTFSSVSPPSATISSLVRLTAWKMDVHHIPVIGTVKMRSAGNERYPAGTEVWFNRVSGHRDAKPTACPGTQTYYKLKAVRASAEKLGQPKIYTPSLSTLVVRPDGNGVNESTVFSAKLGRSAAWTLTIADSASVTKRVFAGSGTSIWVRWHGDTAAGALLPTGLYRWRIDARWNGYVARPAWGVLYVVATHPTGTLLRDSARYAVDGSARVDDTSDGIALSSVHLVPPVLTGPGERARYVGAPVPPTLRDGTLLENAATGTRYIWSAGALRRFASDPADVFGLLGYTASAVMKAPASFLATLPPGEDVSDATRHPAGAIVRDATNGSLWVLGGATRRPIGSIAAKTRYRTAEIVEATAGDLALPADLVSPVRARDGAVIRASDGSLWLVAEGKRRRFISWGMWSAMGYTSSMLVSATTSELQQLEQGPIFS